MTGRTGGISGAATDARPWSAAWAAYGACVWALVFSLQSFYYAAGGTVGADTWPPSIAEPVLAREPLWVAVMWATGALKVLLGLFALALAPPWSRRIPRRLLLAAGWSAAAFLGLYGLANLIQHGLMVSGAIALPEGLGRASALWHLVLWDPYWLLGGTLFAAATRRYQRGPR